MKLAVLKCNFKLHKKAKNQFNKTSKWSEYLKRIT